MWIQMRNIEVSIPYRQTKNDMLYPKIGDTKNGFNSLQVD